MKPAATFSKQVWIKIRDTWVIRGCYGINFHLYVGLKYRRSDREWEMGMGKLVQTRYRGIEDGQARAERDIARYVGQGTVSGIFSYYHSFGPSPLLASSSSSRAPQHYNPHPKTGRVRAGSSPPDCQLGPRKIGRGIHCNLLRPVVHAVKT